MIRFASTWLVTHPENQTVQHVLRRITDRQLDKKGNGVHVVYTQNATGDVAALFPNNETGAIQVACKAQANPNKSHLTADILLAFIHNQLEWFDQHGHFAPLRINSKRLSRTDLVTLNRQGLPIE